MTLTKNEEQQKVINKIIMDFKKELFGHLTNQMNTIYQSKNSDYGDSFGEMYRKEGKASFRVVLGHKMNRFETLTREESKPNNESIEDTLIDMANYALMSLIEIRCEYLVKEINKSIEENEFDILDPNVIGGIKEYLRASITDHEVYNENYNEEDTEEDEVEDDFEYDDDFDVIEVDLGDLHCIIPKENVECENTHELENKLKTLEDKFHEIEELGSKIDESIKRIKKILDGKSTEEECEEFNKETLEKEEIKDEPEIKGGNFKELFKYFDKLELEGVDEETKLIMDDIREICCKGPEEYDSSLLKTLRTEIHEMAKAFRKGSDLEECNSDLEDQNLNSDYFEDKINEAEEEIEFFEENLVDFEEDNDAHKCENKNCKHDECKCKDKPILKNKIEIEFIIEKGEDKSNK